MVMEVRGESEEQEVGNGRPSLRAISCTRASRSWRTGEPSGNPVDSRRFRPARCSWSASRPSALRTARKPSTCSEVVGAEAEAAPTLD